MFGIGMSELLVILIVALIIFGPTRLPELARSLGRAMAEFRRASTDLRSTFEEAAHEPKPAPPAEVAAAAAPLPASSTAPAAAAVPGAAPVAAAAKPSDPFQIDG